MKQEELVKDLLYIRNKNEEKLKKYITKYFIKYIKKLTDKKLSIKEIQKILYKIPSWSKEELEDEYSKFLSKIDISKEKINKLMEEVYISNIKIITKLYSSMEINIPSCKMFWYKCQKRLAKYIYENPKLLSEGIKEKKKELDNIIKNVLIKLIPIKKLSNNKIEQYNYDSSFSKSENIKFNEREIEENEKDDANLRYIPSEQYENEYYKSDEENEKKYIEL